MPESDASLAQRLRRLAHEAGAVAAFARVCGIPQRTMAGYVGGQHEPRASDLLKIANAARVNIRWLVAGDGPMRDGERAAADENGPGALRHDLLETVISGVELASLRAGRSLTPRQRARVIVALYNILHRRFGVPAGGVAMHPPARPEHLVPDVLDLISLLV